MITRTHRRQCLFSCPVSSARKSLAPLLLAWLTSLAAGQATRPSTAPPIEKKGWTLTFHDEFDGNRPDATTVFPGSMDIDYVRVYRRQQ
jgi:hypothetical protein